MHLPLLTTLLLALSLFGVFASAEKDHLLVRRKNRDITQAINRFCGYTEDMVVPSTKAMQGMASENGRAVVRVRGDCSPRQWVPRK